ncbi:MAG TPA: hypothetical protein VE911_05345, partial [Candidatus Nitrosopolaris sp.]|nr:hypothetical protein [Candidatus Nitrosopolaris sp.]
MTRCTQWVLGLAVLFLSSGAYAGCFGGRPNGVVNLGEECDDGNLVDTDNCTNTCEIPFCGDTIVRTTHNCGADPSLTCQTNADCARYTKCIIDPADDHCGSLPNHPCTSDADCANLGTCSEACDDGNTNNCDACQNNCTKVTGCGDGAVCPPEQCDPPASRGGAANCSDACKVAVCGDGIVDRPQEECDNGAAKCVGGKADGADCGTCAQNQVCEDGGGHCGFGNTEWRPGDCRLNCKLAFCGDGVVDSGTTAHSSFTLAARHDGQDTTTTTVRGTTTTTGRSGTTTTTSTTLPPPMGEVCDDGLKDPARGPSLADDMDDCPNGPLAIAAGVACKIVNRCGDAFPHVTDTSATCGGIFTQCGGGPGPCTTPATLEQCDNGNGALKTCQGKLGQFCQTNTDCGTKGPCVALKTCRNQPDVFCTTDHDCDLFPCTGTGCTIAPDVCGNSDTTPNACRNTVKVPDTTGLIVDEHCVNPVCGDDVVDAGEGCDEGIGTCVSSSAQNAHECSTAPNHQACLQVGGSCVDADGADRGASCDSFPSNCLS